MLPSKYVFQYFLTFYSGTLYLTIYSFNNAKIKNDAAQI